MLFYQVKQREAIVEKELNYMGTLKEDKSYFQVQNSLVSASILADKNVTFFPV